MWSSARYQAIAELIAERTGLKFPASRHVDVEKALDRAFGRSAPDSEGVRALLEASGSARDELIAELTIGESYFFRDVPQFTLLRERIIPALAARPAHVPIRLWSAGCATGEEAYSLAMLCEEQGVGDRAQVIGTDISRVRLGAAKRGLYTRWSFRGMSEDAIARWFAPAGRAFELRRDMHARVDFRYLNLAEDRYPSLTAGMWGMDLILCRNVLIYFDRATVAHVARRLLDTLSDDGWLVLGASDPAISEMVECEVELTASGLVYRRRGPHSSLTVAPPRNEEPWLTGWSAEVGGQPPVPFFEPVTPGAAEPEPTPGSPDAAPNETGEPMPGTPGAGRASPPKEDPPARQGETAEPTLQAVEAAYAARDYPRAADLAAGLTGSSDSVALRVLLIRSLANRGDLAGAGHAASAALDAHRMSAELMYLHAVLLGEAGQYRESAAAARRALYLDRSLVVAHLALANALERSGERTGARRSLRTAEELLAALPPETEVGTADGERAGRLLASVRAQLRLLTAA